MERSNETMLLFSRESRSTSAAMRWQSLQATDAVVGLRTDEAEIASHRASERGE